MNRARIRIGVIADTHGLLRAEALAALHGSQHIIHAGDIGDPSILEQLAALAPVTAVLGNNDRGPACAGIPEAARLVVEGIVIDVVHDLATLDPSPARSVVVSGHSHRPRIEHSDGVLYLNPGSAGPRRFSLPVSVGCLLIERGQVSGELLTLAVGASPATRRRR